jgi:hypothetical protein
VVCLIAGIDAFGDIVLALTYTSPGIPVSCCTVIGDIQIPVASIQTPSILGEGKGELGTLLYHLFHMITLGLLTLLLVTKRWKSSKKGHVASLIASLLLAILGLVIFSAAMIDQIGPTLMKLPHHHCPYCLLQYVPISIAFICLEFLGNFSLGWAFITGTWGRVKGTKTLLSEYVRKLWKLAFACLFASWILVIICLKMAN